MDVITSSSIAAATPETKARPIGVVILAVLFIVNAIIVFAMGGWLATLGILSLGFFGILCVAPWMLFGVLFLLIGIGLLMMKRWAWILALIFGILSLIVALLNLTALGLLPSDADIPTMFKAFPAINFVVDLIIVIYLMMVRDHFKKA